MTNTKIRVVVADDHPFLRKGIVATLADEPDFEVVGEASDGLAAQAKCKQFQPDILLLDLNMPGVSPTATIEIVQRDSPHTKVIILTAFDDFKSIQQTIGIGAKGYLLKEEGLSVVVQAIRTIIAGGKWFSEAALMKLVQQTHEDFSKLNLFEVLTDRERQLLKGMALGESDLEIQKALAVQDRTFRGMLNAIYTKLGVKTRVEAAVFAVRHGLLEGERDEKQDRN